jgi:hypothetical protein
VVNFFLRSARGGRFEEKVSHSEVKERERKKRARGPEEDKRPLDKEAGGLAVY